jgi:hypothetical protein
MAMSQWQKAVGFLPLAKPASQKTKEPKAKS